MAAVNERKKETLPKIYDFVSIFLSGVRYRDVNVLAPNALAVTVLTGYSISTKGTDRQFYFILFFRAVMRKQFGKLKKKQKSANQMAHAVPLFLSTNVPSPHTLFGERETNLRKNWLYVIPLNDHGCINSTTHQSF